MGIDHDADRFGYADGVGQLHGAAVREVGGDDVLGDVAGHVARGAVYFRGIFSGECSAAVCRHTAVSVDNNFASRDACRCPIAVHQSRIYRSG